MVGPILEVCFHLKMFKFKVHKCLWFQKKTNLSSGPFISGRWKFNTLRYLIITDRKTGIYFFVYTSADLFLLSARPWRDKHNRSNLNFFATITIIAIFGPRFLIRLLFLL